MGENEITAQIIGSAMKVHSELGPGLLERAYEVCLYLELARRGFEVGRQVRLPLYYDDLPLKLHYRIDLLVADTVVVEVKAVSAVTDLHKAQLLSYLRLSRRRLGLLLNFHVIHLRDGIVRLVNG